MSTRRLAAAALGCALTAASIADDTFRSPDVVVLGDSQIAFGSGLGFHAFFSTLNRQCAATPGSRRALDGIDASNIAVLGVRSTSVDNWVARDGDAKDKVCGVDPNWNRNAGTYGVINRSDDKYVQIGEGAAYQFCAVGASPLEAMFRPGYYEPKLLVLSFLGVSARRWAESPALARLDVEAMHRQLPAEVPCVFVTTAPAYKAETVELRQRAQANVRAAFASPGSHCTFVPGMTPATVAANLGVDAHFRRNDAGKVIDPFHPNAAGTARFLALQREPLCAAVVGELGGPASGEARAERWLDSPGN